MKSQGGIRKKENHELIEVKKERSLKRSNGQNSNAIRNLNMPKTKKYTGFSDIYFIPVPFSYVNR